MANKSIYLRDEDEPIYKRAMKLLAFHEDKSLSQFILEQCEAVVKRYDSNVQEGSDGL